MLETVNSWLPIVSALVAGLLFIWRIFNKLNLTLVTLNTSVDRLNRHLNDVDDRTARSEKRLQDQEVRIVIIENHLGIYERKQYKGDDVIEN